VKLSLDTVLPARAVDTACLMAGVRVTMIFCTRPPSWALLEALLTLLDLDTWVWPKLPELLENPELETLEPEPPKLPELLPLLENPELEPLEPDCSALATALWMEGLRVLSTLVTMSAEFLDTPPLTPEPCVLEVKEGVIRVVTAGLLTTVLMEGVLYVTCLT